MDVIENIAEIVIDEIGEHIGGAFADDIDVFRTADGLDRAFEGRFVHICKRRFEVADVGADHGGSDVAFPDEVIGDIDALDGGQLRAKALLQFALELRITGKAKLDGKAHDGRFGNAHLCAQLGGRHIGRFFAVLQNIGGNPLMAL